MIPVFWHRTYGKWASAFPRFILDATEKVDRHFGHFQDVPSQFTHKVEAAVICIPGEDSTSEYGVLNGRAEQFEQVVWIIFADEQGLFDPSLLRHKNQKVWAFAPQYPIHKAITTAAPFGWPTDCPEMVRADGYRPFGYFFSGQITHGRREQCIAAAADADNALGLRGLVIKTHGFAQGIARQEYYDLMGRSRFVLCPGGPCTADSFRFAEALECGSIPIADEFPGERTWPAGYWNAVCGPELPFPTIQDWSTLPDVLREWSEDHEAKRDRCMRWWAAYKNGLIERMREDLST